MTAHEPTPGAIATPAPPPIAPPGAAEAILLAGPAAELRLHGETLLARLRGQLASLGVASVHLAGAADDLRALAAGSGTLVIAPGDLVAHGEALAGLLADPRLDTAVLAGQSGAPLVLKVAGGDRPALAAAAERVGGDGDLVPRLAGALAGAGVHVGAAPLRGLTCVRAETAADVERAAAELAAVDEERVRLDSAVKANDGFFTTFFVSSYSRYVARWAAGRGFTPNQVTAASALLGLGSAVAFAFGTRAGLVAGAVLLQVAFTTDCVDGQLARYTRRFSQLGAWLDSVFDRAKEYAVYAGLALGGHHLWTLAGAALALQTFRHTLEFSYQGTRRGVAAAHPGRGATVWLRKVIALPIGERFAAISLTAALGSARLTFAVLLVWGAVAAAYTLAGRVRRSLA